MEISEKYTKNPAQNHKLILKIKKKYESPCNLMSNTCTCISEQDKLFDYTRYHLQSGSVTMDIKKNLFDWQQC